jgi:hypothetical protein
MSQITTTIPNKSTGDQLTAAEFNELNSVVNANSVDAESQLTAKASASTAIDNRLTAEEGEDSAYIQQYHTVDLPTSGINDGGVMYDLSSEVPVYSNNNAWYRCSDNADLSTFTEVDMFIVMGQSNADGKGKFADLDSQTGRSLEGLNRTGIQIHQSSIDQSTRVYQPGVWEAIDPATNAAQSSGRFGPEVGFSDTVKAIVDGGGNATYDKPVAILKFAKGATNLYNNWDAPSGDCYTAMVQDIPRAKFELGQANYKFNIRGMIWYQGESDSSDQAVAEAYGANLTTLFADIRSRFDKPELPIVICKVAYETSPPAYIETVRTQQQNVADADSNIAIIDTAVYERRDAVHLNAKGMYELGEDITTLFTSIL